MKAKKKYEKVDFSKLDNLNFETNKKGNEIFLKLDENGIEDSMNQPKKKIQNFNEESDSESDSSLDQPKNEFKPLKNQNNKQQENADVDFLNLDFN